MLSNYIHYIKYFLFFLFKKEFGFFKKKFSDHILNEIYRHGYYKINNFWDLSKCQITIKVLDSLFEKQIYSFKDNLGSDTRLFGAENFDQNILEFSNDALFKNIISNFSNNPINFFCTMANKVKFKKNNLGSGMGWHRDGFYKSFKCMLYLNNVDENNGCFQIINKTNSYKDIVRDSSNYNINFRTDRLDNVVKKILAKEPNRLISIDGKAGCLIIFDTSLIHRGSPIKKNNTRYALTNYYYLKIDINDELYKKMNILHPAIIR